MRRPILRRDCPLRAESRVIGPPKPASRRPKRGDADHGRSMTRTSWWRAAAFGQASDALSLDCASFPLAVCRIAAQSRGRLYLGNAPEARPRARPAIREWCEVPNFASPDFQNVAMKSAEEPTAKGEPGTALKAPVEPLRVSREWWPVRPLPGSARSH